MWLPSLVQDLAENVDKVLGALRALPPLQASSRPINEKLTGGVFRRLELSDFTA